MTELPTTAYENWADAPQTPGDWRYAAPGDGSATSVARFGDDRVLAALSCIGSTQTLRLQRMEQGSAPDTPPQMTIRTEYGDRTLIARSEQGITFIEIPARDTFAEAIAFSKGRFAVETPGLPPLFLPAWPEVSRVIEDCRGGRL